MSYSEFSKFSNLKKIEVAIQLHPGHLQPKTLTFTLRKLVGVIFNKTGPLFLGFH